MKLKLIVMLPLLAYIFYIFANQGVEFDVAPQSFSSCDQPAHISNLRWSVTKQGVTSVSIFVNGPGEAETLWGPGELIGTRETGAWVADGLTFTLRDQQGAVLARRTIHTTRCAGAKFGE
jgi:hypothetical protein